MAINNPASYRCHVYRTDAGFSAVAQAHRPDGGHWYGLSPDVIITHNTMLLIERRATPWYRKRAAPAQHLFSLRGLSELLLERDVLHIEQGMMDDWHLSVSRNDRCVWVAGPIGLCEILSPRMATRSIGTYDFGLGCSREYAASVDTSAGVCLDAVTVIARDLCSGRPRFLGSLNQ